MEEDDPKNLANLKRRCLLQRLYDGDTELATIERINVLGLRRAE